MFPNNLVLYLKDLKLTVFAIFALKLVASSINFQNHKLSVVSEKFELYYINFYIGITKSSAPSIVVSSIFVIHLVNGAQFLNAICVAGAAATVILPLTKM